MLTGGKNETVKNGKMWKKRKTETQAGNAGGSKCWHNMEGTRIIFGSGEKGRES